MDRRLLVYIFFIGLAASAGAVGSGGYTNQVVGVKALGMGNAFTAVADDPSAVYFNPAGLAKQRSLTIAAGAFPIVSHTNYTADVGGNDTTKNGTALVPYYYISYPFKDRWTAALGVNAPFGLATRWRDNGPLTLKYVATDSRLEHIGFNPTAAYRVSEQLSAGVGMTYAWVAAQLDSRLNEGLLNGTFGGDPNSPDGWRNLKGEGHGWGYNLGLMYEPIPGHNVGVSYRSAIKAKISGETRLSGLTDASIGLFGGDSYKTDTKTDLKFPASVLLGYSYKTERWTWAVDGEWVGYSAVKETRLSFQETDPQRLGVLETDNPIKRDWKDTWNIGAGFNWAATSALQVRAGAYYFPSVVPEKNWDPSLPDSTVVGYTIGGGYSIGSWTLDVGYNLLEFGKKSVKNDVGASSLSTINGSYKTVGHIFSIGVMWRGGGSSQGK